MLNIKPGIGILKSKGGVSLLLDDNDGAEFAVSLRKLNSAYSGNCIRVRRSNDNAEADIGFNDEGLLDVVALKAHCGYNNGFVAKWYDQSGNTNDGVQATLLNQPLIYYKGFVLTMNGLPFMLFKAHNATYINATANSHGMNSHFDFASNLTMDSDAGMVSSVLSRVTSTRSIASLSGTTSATPVYPGGTYSSTTLFIADTNRYSNAGTTADYNNPHIHIGRYTATELFLSKNGFPLNTSTTVAYGRANTINELGRYTTSVGGQGAGRTQEVIFWDKDMADKEFAIHTDQSKFYFSKGNSIVLPTTGLFGHWKADNGVIRNGTTTYLQEWKDSSANGNNIPQTNASYQPEAQLRYRSTTGDNIKWTNPADEAWPATSHNRLYFNNDSFRSTAIAPTYSDAGFTICAVIESNGGTYNTIVQGWDLTSKYKFDLGTDANTSTLRMRFSQPVSGGSNNVATISCLDEVGAALDLDDRTNFIVASWSAAGGFKCRINGIDQTVSLSSHSAASAHASHFSIGDGKESWSKWAGWIGEVIFYQNQLSDDDVKIVEKYFRHKWFGSALPTDFSDLIVWTDAMQGVTKDGSNLVSQWNDLSGNNNHFVQATGSKQPTWTASEYNGRPALVFDGTDDFMKSPGLITGAGRTVFMVMHTTTGHGHSNKAHFSSYHAASTTHHWLQRSGGTWRNNKATIAGGTSSTKEHGQVLYFGTPAYSTWTFMTPPDSDTAGAMFRVGSSAISNGHANWGGDSRGSGGINGAVTSSYTFSQTPNGEGIWLMTDTQETQFQKFKVAEVIVYNRMLETYEHEAIASYLHRKYKA